MATYIPVIPPASLGQALRPLCDLSDDEFSALMGAVSGPRSFSLPKEDLDLLRSKIPALAANVRFLLAALSFLNSHIARVLESGMLFSDAIRAAVDDLDKDADWQESKDKVRSRLALLLQPTERHKRFEKVQKLQSGFIPNALSFATFIDLRPDFGDGEELSLHGYLPVIQFRINTDSPGPEGKRLICQMSEDALIELKKVIERAESKLAMLRKQSVLAPQIIKI
jgi:hypothetical protein